MNLQSDFRLRRDHRSTAQVDGRLKISLLLRAVLFIFAATPAAAFGSSPALLHSSDQFACSYSGFLTQAACEAGGGNWNPARKWPNGWGLPTGEYGVISCATCHQKNSENIKRLRSTITAGSGTFPGSAVSALSAVPGGSSDYGNDDPLGNGSGHINSQRVCEVCHRKTFYHRYDTTTQTGLLTHFNGSDCVSCHTHRQGFRAGCSDCHGNSNTGAAWPDGTDNNINRLYSAADDDTLSHERHVAAIGTGNDSCASCHPLPAPTATTHINGTPDLTGTGFSYASGTRTCSNISCHSGSNATWGGSACIGCHATAQGSRAAITGQFSANSHHVQGVAISDVHCYQCHWEANIDGTINAAYHGRNATAAVDLVVYGAGSRPLGYIDGTTAIQYVANGDRTEIAKLNQHCLGCHSDANNASIPFGDGKTPKQYAWDGTSIDARYGQTGTTLWGKYTTVPNAARKNQTKAYSAHGNATGNQGGWSAGAATAGGTGIDGDLPDTRNGTVIVACFDCHNSHGSTVAGSTTSYASTTVNGGLLKNTIGGTGGYSASYQPAAFGSDAEKNKRNPGASLCFDCHLNASASATRPWGYQSTFGATSKILGYYDAPDFSTLGSGSHVRYPYKDDTGHTGGHFGASSELMIPPSGDHQIAGLCTPCHDPHGVSPTLANQQYAVPLLKGTWVTSPYQEDVAPANNSPQTAAPQGTPLSYHIDQNTFGGNIMQLISSGIAQDDSRFAGLCLRCHPKDTLTVDATATGTANLWQSKDRIHEAVKGWKTSPGTVKHSYTCSKCHSPHGGTGLPRLMITNCLDWPHKERVAYNNSAIIQAECIGGCVVGGGGGSHPGNYEYDDQWYGDNHWEPRQASLSASCHEGNNGVWSDQRWNRVTPWADEPTLTITSGPTPQNSVRSSPTAETVKFSVNWMTNVRSNSEVDFGPTASYGQTASSLSPVTSHWVDLDGLANHTTYHYRVRSKTLMGQQVESGDRTFYISVPPDVPTLVDRGDKSCPDGCTVTVAWNPSSDPDGETVWYQIEIDTVNGFTSASRQMFDWIPGTVSGSTLTGDIGPLATGTTWYWHVRARDNAHPEAVSDWSAPDSFRTLPDYPPPSVPILYNEWDVTNCGTNLAPECSTILQWRPSSTSDPELGPIEYYLEIDNDPGFTSASRQVLNYPAGTLSGSYMTAEVGPLATDTTWYWHVKARYTNPVTRESTFSAADEFDTIFPVPSRPTTLVSSPSPALCENGTCPSVLLSWQSSSGAYDGEVRHIVEIDTVSGFNSADKRTFGPLAIGVVSQLIEGLEPDKTWYWRVRAQDAVYSKSFSSWSVIKSFQTMTYPSPSTPTALFIQDAVCPDGCSVALNWSASTAYNGGTAEYLVQVDDDPNFTSIDDSFGWLASTGGSTGTLGLGTWYWRVIARDVDHISAESAWSNTGTFNVLASVPATKSITFTWADAPIDSISIDGTLYGGTGSITKTITTSFTAAIVGSPGQVGGGEPDPDWIYYGDQAPGGSPGYMAAVFTPNDGNTFTVKVGSVGGYRAYGGYGGGASYVAKDNSTIMYVAGAGGGGGGEAAWLEEEYDYIENGLDGFPGEGFGSAIGGVGGAGSSSGAGQPGGHGGSGSASVTPATFTGDSYNPRVTITLN